jgi:hypothetical protein
MQHSRKGEQVSALLWESRWGDPDPTQMIDAQTDLWLTSFPCNMGSRSYRMGISLEPQKAASVQCYL